MSLSLSQGLRQSLSLSQNLAQRIDFGKLISMPENIFDAVAEAISSDPEKIEDLLGKNGPVTFNKRSATVQSLYDSLFATKQNNSANVEGLIIEPNLSDLADLVQNEALRIIPDVTYIGVKGGKPQIYYSEALTGRVALTQIQIDSAKFPKTAKMMGQLHRFNAWKTESLMKAYLCLGEAQREYFEDFNITELHLYNRDKLADEMNLEESTISRLLGNRYVRAINIKNEDKVIRAKDLFVTADDLLRFQALPSINEVLKMEWESGEALSDNNMADLVPNVVRRTIAKYRLEAGIPGINERNKIYRSGTLNHPYQISCEL